MENILIKENEAEVKNEKANISEKESKVNDEKVHISENHMKITFDSKSENEALARVTAAAFVTQLDPTLEEINDIKTAISEAVTNSIIHGYEDDKGIVEMKCSLKSKIVQRDDGISTYGKLTVLIKDSGVGINDVEQAMEPLYTTKPEMDRAGMGFAFMQLFMDEVNVWSKPGIGTQVIMTKELKKTKKQV